VVKSRVEEEGDVLSRVDVDNKSESVWSVGEMKLLYSVMMKRRVWEKF
jgi:hypothetical protein